MRFRALFCCSLADALQGIAEGRLIFDNLQKCITYVLASNVPEIIPFVMFVTLGIPLGLEIVQILAVDLGAPPALQPSFPPLSFCNCGCRHGSHARHLHGVSCAVCVCAARGDAGARYELAEDDLMKRKPRNALTDRLTNGRLFCLGYCVLGVRACPLAPAQRQQRQRDALQVLETAMGYLVFFEMFREYGFDQVQLRGAGINFEFDNTQICNKDCCPLW